YFFMPKKLKNDEKAISYLVDGGLLSNFPLWLFKNKQKKRRPMQGVRLSETVGKLESEHTHNVVDMLQAIFKTMLKANDTRYISVKKSKDIIFTPIYVLASCVAPIYDFIKYKLILLGRNQTEQFLKTWTF